MYLFTYVCMCMYACMYVCMYVCMYGSIIFRWLLSRFQGMYVCMYVCMLYMCVHVVTVTGC